MGLDRDEDSALDGLDNCPAAPNAGGWGTCTAGDLALRGAACAADAECGGGGICSMAQEDSDGNGRGDACEPGLVPEPAIGWMLAAGVTLLGGLERSRRTRA